MPLRCRRHLTLPNKRTTGPDFGPGRFFCAPSMGVTFGVQVPAKVDHDDRSEAQLRKGDRLWEGSVERIHGPTYRNRI